MTFVFYDTETTGTDTAFDQILQFGAIRTDDDLNEIDRFEIRCRLQPHIVPAPMALKVTGIRPGMLLDPVLPSHYEAMRQVHAKLSDWSPWECHELCVSGLAHAGFRYGHALKRSSNTIANWFRAANHSLTFLPPFSKFRIAR